MSGGRASNGPDFDTESARNVNPDATLDRFGKFDLALSQRLVQSSQLLAAHPRGRGPLRCLSLALLSHFDIRA